MLSRLLSPTPLQQAVAPVTTLIRTLTTSSAVTPPEEPVAQAVQPVSAPPPQDGVIFDLSDAALATLQNAQASQSGTPAASGTSAAIPVAAATAAPARLSWSAPPAETPAVRRAAPFQPPIEADPTEEARARAQAISAMEKAALQSLIDNIKASAKAEIAAQDRAEPARGDVSPPREGSAKP